MNVRQAEVFDGTADRGGAGDFVYVRRCLFGGFHVWARGGKMAANVVRFRSQMWNVNMFLKNVMIGWCQPKA